MENETNRGQKKTNHVGLKTNLRKPALLLFAGWCAGTRRVNVRKSLALADDLLCSGSRLSGWGAGRAAEASRLPG